MGFSITDMYPHQLSLQSNIIFFDFEVIAKETETSRLYFSHFCFSVYSIITSTYHNSIHVIL